MNKSFVIPFTWEKRRALIFDRLLYIPAQYDDHHSFSMPSFETLFENSNPVSVEFCSGNGQWIIEKAKAEKGINWIAVEKRFDRARKIWSKREQLGLKNLFIVLGEALTFSRFYLLNSCLESVYVNFPDPWPKRRHAKNRLISAELANELKRVICVGGEAILVSDDFDTMSRIIESFNGWENLFENGYTLSWPNYGNSFFDELWRIKNRKIYYLRFKNRGRGI